MPKRSYDAKIIHTGENDVSINFINEKYVYRDLREAFGDGEKVTVEINSRRKPRTLKQNALFHAYCGIIADETGNSLERVKSTLKLLYCQKPFKDNDDNDIVNEKTGEVLTYVQDTADMDTIEKSKLIDDTRMFALEWFGINLPLPEEQIPFKFKNQK